MSTSNQERTTMVRFIFLHRRQTKFFNNVQTSKQQVIKNNNLREMGNSEVAVG